MNRLVGILVSVAVGAAAAYMLDPDRGRTRRAIAREQAIAMTNRLNDALEGTSRHWSNIALGYLAEARSLFERTRQNSRDTITRVGGPACDGRTTPGSTRVSRAASRGHRCRGARRARLLQSTDGSRAPPRLSSVRALRVIGEHGRDARRHAHARRHVQVLVRSVRVA